MVLVALAKAFPLLRKYLLEKCFPNTPTDHSNASVEYVFCCSFKANPQYETKCYTQYSYKSVLIFVGTRAPPNWQSNPIGSKLITLMSGHNMARTYYVNEFIFQLCGEDGTNSIPFQKYLIIVLQ